MVTITVATLARLLLAFTPAVAFNPCLSRTQLPTVHSVSACHSPASHVRMAAGKQEDESGEVGLGMATGGAAAATGTQMDVAAEARRLGLFLDMPLCRFSWCIMPHQQIALNIWQPMYVDMFTKLAAEPEPRYYFHVLLPGGADSLGKLGYELESGTQASLTGTLMRIVRADKQADGRLQVIVQGLARGVVLRATQYLPYSKGDVQLLADKEGLLAAARAGERYLQDTEDATIEATQDSVRQRLIAAASAAETEGFFPYEARRLSIDANFQVAGLNFFNTSATAVIRGINDTVTSALREAPISTISADRLNLDSLYNQSCVWEKLQAAAAVAKVEATAGGVGAEEAESQELEKLAVLEVQLWLEFDRYFQILQKLAKTSIPIPSQLLGMIPPPPQPAGWPTSFKFLKIALGLESQYRAIEKDRMGKRVDEVVAESFVPVDVRYPLRKRAERLSWFIWAVINNQKIGVNAFGGSPLQAVIEAEGTAQRLEMALTRFKTILSQFREAGADIDDVQDSAVEPFANADDVVRLNRLFYSEDASDSEEDESASDSKQDESK